MIELSASGPNLASVFRDLHRYIQNERAPLRLRVDGDAVSIDEHWFERAVAREISAHLKFDERDEDGDWVFLDWMSIRRRVTNCGKKDFDPEPTNVLDTLAKCEFELASVLGPHAREWGDLYEKTYGFSMGHFSNDYAVVFKGDGFKRLVSRRWLEFGPWKTHWRGDDLCLVQFHELGIDADATLAQALPGHERMGISDIGGFLQEPYPYHHEIRGVYVANERRTNIVVPVGETVSQHFMQDACALRAEGQDQKGKPIDSIAFVFMTEDDARKHLHELWLRELECRALIDGQEVRLDTDYNPTPNPPQWVRTLNEQELHE